MSGKQVMIHTRYAGLAMVACALLMRQGGAGEQELGRWIITIRKAVNLKNRDWGKQKLSDPYVQVVANDKESTTTWKTRVVRDSLNPEWNQEFVWHDTPAWQRGPLLRMTVYDDDPNLGPGARAFLGKTRFSVALSGEGGFRLDLRGKFDAGVMPGMLFISVRHEQEKSTVVPDAVGMPLKQAVADLRKRQLRFRTKTVFTSRPTGDAGRVFMQNPRPGTRVKPGHEVMLLIHRPMTRPMPSVKGLALDAARDRLAFLDVPPRIIRVHRQQNSWFRVVAQSVPAGRRISLNTQVTLTCNIPGPDARVEIPKLAGLDAPAAEKMLRESYLQPEWRKRESDFERNGKVVSQTPDPGTRVAPGSRVAVTLGHWADGLGYYSARTVPMGQVEKFVFNKPGITQFRAVEIRQTGYLVLRKLNAPFTLKCNFYNARSSRSLEPRNRFFDQALRVTPGRWIFGVYAEFENDVSEQPAMVKVDFVSEFDRAEPNDTFAAATPLVPDARLEIGFAGTNDRDFYSLSLARGGYIKIKLDHAFIRQRKRTVIPRLWIYDARRRKIHCGGVDVVRWLAAGAYYLKFECENSREQFDDKPYAVDVSFMGDPDHMEPNDTPRIATPVKLPASLNVCYHTGDRDCYRLQSGVPGYAVFSHCRDLGFAVMLRQQDHAGDWSRRRHLPCAVRVGGQTVVELSPEMRADYYVENATPLNILWIPGQDDPYEPNDNLAQARPLLLGQAVTALSLPADDIDTYSFRLSAGSKVVLEVLEKEDKVVLQARLFNRGGVKRGGNLYLPATVDLPAGQYLVQVFQEPGLQGLHLQPYRFRVRLADIPADRQATGSRYRSVSTPDTAVRQGIDLAREAYKRYLAGKYQEAIDLYLRAGKLAPRIAAIWNDLGASYFHLGRTAEARTEFIKAAKLNPGYALAWRNLAVLHGKQGDFARALPLSDKAVRLEASADNLRYAGYTYFFAGAKDPAKRRDLWSQAADYLAQSLARKPDDLARKRLLQIRKFLRKASE